MRGRPIAAETVERLRARFGEGQTDAAIAVSTGVAKSTVARYRVVLGFYAAARPARSAAERSKARILRQENLSVPQISERLNICTATVYSWVKDIPWKRPVGYGRARVGTARWTADEIVALRRLYPLATRAEILAEIAHPWGSIIQKAGTLGIRRDSATSRKRERDIHPIATRLRQERLRQGLTLNALASMIERPGSHLGKFEIGAARPSFASLFAWLDALGLQIDLVQKTRVNTEVAIDLARRTVTWGECTSRLTGKEVAILAALSSANGPLSKVRLHFALYGDDPDGGADVKIVDVFICKLRKRLPAGMIETIWGFGYAWNGPIPEVQLPSIESTPRESFEDAEAALRRERVNFAA
jgi:transcriptional regulator with XRE-family HTH domain